MSQKYNKTGKNRWEIWLEYVYALRILSDAIVIPALRERALANSELVVRRFHAEIYDEICAQYAIEHKPANPVNSLLLLQHALVALVPNVASQLSSLLLAGVGWTHKPSISSEKQEIIDGVLEDVLFVFKLIITIPDTKLYANTMVIERFDDAVNVEQRPFIKNNTDAAAYPPPLYEIFNSSSFCFKEQFSNGVAFGTKKDEAMKDDVKACISNFINGI